MNVLLNNEQKRWVELAEKVGEEIAEKAREYDERAEFTKENFEILREHGFLKLAVPERYDGYGKDTGNAHITAYLVTEALSRKCPTTAWNLAIHFHQCGAVARLGNEEQRSRIFGDIVNNGAIMGSLGSEVNPQQIKAAKNQERKLIFNAGLTPTEGGFLANGSKHFCSLGPVGDYLLYWSIAPGTENSGQGLQLAIVTKDSPGLTWYDNGWEDIIGLRGTVSTSAELKDVFIPWKNVLGEPGDFVQDDPYTLELSQAFHMAGIAQGAYDFIIEVLQNRPFLMNEDGLKVQVGQMDAALQATKGSLWYANALWEAKQYGAAALASFKALSFAKETALSITTNGFEIVGTRSLFKFNPLERLWREARTASLHTRHSQMLGLVAEGAVAGEYFPKQKYGPKVENRKTWKDLGIEFQSTSAVNN